MNKFLEIMLKKASQYYDSKNYYKSCAFYQTFFKQFFELSQIDYENSSYDFSKDIFNYSNAFLNCLLSQSSIDSTDPDEFQEIKEYLEETEKHHNISDPKSENYKDIGSFIEETKIIIKTIQSQFFEEEDNLDDFGPTLNLSKRTYSTTRPEGYPQRYTYDGHIFVFANRRANECRYVCKYGSNKHKGMRKCNAAITLPFPLPDDTIEGIDIRVLNGIHTCPVIQNVACKIINDAQIRTWVEQIYLSMTPRPTRTQIVSLVFQKAKDESQEGEEIQIPSETLINNFYSELEKRHKIQDDDFQKMLKTKRGTVFERFKYRFGEGSLIICYCSDFQQKCISESHFLFIDGTFDTAPLNFEQVLVIMGQTFHMNVPLSYILLPNKKQETYVKAFTLFKHEVQSSFWSGATFITDFEKAEFNAVKQVLMDSSHHLQLCYFHYVQSMIRHFKDYEDNSVTLYLIEISKMLPFMPQKLVEDAFEVMQTYKEIERFVDYFNKNYLKMYDFEDWSVYGKPSKVVITNNVVESHNNQLKRIIGPDPSLQKFEIKIQEIEDDIERRYEQRTNNVPEFHRYNEFVFKKKFKELIDILRKERATSKHKNDFEDLFNQEEEYFRGEKTEENISDIISSISSDSDDILEKQKEENTEIQNEENTEKQNEETEYQQKCNIRKIPESVRKILDEKSKEYHQFGLRSESRKKLIKETYEIVQPIVNNISITQIRTWFGNTKNKL